MAQAHKLPPAGEVNPPQDWNSECDCCPGCKICQFAGEIQVNINGNFTYSDFSDGGIYAPGTTFNSSLTWEVNATFVRGIPGPGVAGIGGYEWKNGMCYDEFVDECRCSAFEDFQINGVFSVAVGSQWWVSGQYTEVVSRTGAFETDAIFEGRIVMGNMSVRYDDVADKWEILPGAIFSVQDSNGTAWSSHRCGLNHLGDSWTRTWMTNPNPVASRCDHPNGIYQSLMNDDSKVDGDLTFTSEINVTITKTGQGLVACEEAPPCPYTPYFYYFF